MILGDNELDDLDALVRDAGWKRFLTHVDQHWGDAAVVSRMETAVGQQLGDETASKEYTQAILAAKRHIRALIEWPTLRLRELHAKEDQTNAVKPGEGRQPFTRTRQRVRRKREM